MASREIGEPVDTGAAAIGLVDSLSEQQTILEETVELPANGVHTIDAGPDGTEAGRRLEIEIRATSE